MSKCQSLTWHVHRGRSRKIYKGGVIVKFVKGDTSKATTMLEVLCIDSCEVIEKTCEVWNKFFISYP